MLVLDLETGRQRHISDSEFNSRLHRIVSKTKVSPKEEKTELTTYDPMDLSIPMKQPKVIFKSDAGLADPGAVRGGKMVQTGGPFIKKPFPVKTKDLSSEDIMSEIEKSFNNFSVKASQKKIKGGMISMM